MTLNHPGPWFRIYTVRESQGLFPLGQGKSGKLAMVRGKIAFTCCRLGKEFRFSSSKKYLDFLV